MLEQHEQSTQPTIRIAAKILALFTVVGALIAGAIVAYVQFANLGQIHDHLDVLTKRPIAIVLGASVKPDGSPSDALRDRILTGADLYHAGKVDALLMTGDDGKFHVDEIQTMIATAREAGVPEKAILTDGHGYRTYESCKRAVQIFNIRSAIVVTQRFHLGRAIYLCESFGMDVDGMVADRQTYARSTHFWLRDLAASMKAFFDVHVVPPGSPVESVD